MSISQKSLEKGLTNIIKAKLYASRVATEVSRLAVEWLGGVGYTREFPAEKFYRDSLIGSIYEGSSNIQKQTIAKILQKQYRR
jgi:short/branched chain acyl-CoA dehydrogenase